MNLDFRPILLNNGDKYTDYDMRVVLTWEDLLNSDAKDLDLFVEFDVSDRHRCNIGFYLPLCYGAITNYKERANNEDIQQETITVNTMANSTYLIYVAVYLDKQVLDESQVQESMARVDIYNPSMQTASTPLVSLNVPFESADGVDPKGRPYRYWAVACINGQKTQNFVYVLNLLLNQPPTVDLCNDYVS